MFPKQVTMKIFVALSNVYFSFQFTAKQWRSLKGKIEK